MLVGVRPSLKPWHGYAPQVEPVDHARCQKRSNTIFAQARGADGVDQFPPRTHGVYRCRHCLMVARKCERQVRAGLAIYPRLDGEGVDSDEARFTPADSLPYARGKDSVSLTLRRTPAEPGNGAIVSILSLSIAQQNAINPAGVPKRFCAAQRLQGAITKNRTLFFRSSPRRRFA